MPTEFIVRVTVTEQRDGGHSATREYRFSRLPISIGRAPENDVRISNRFVSNAHARIEEVGGRLCVCDLDSRNGVQVRVRDESVRIPARTPYEVARTGFEFSLGSEVWLSFESGRPTVPRAPIEAPAPPRAVRTPAEFSAIGDGLPVLPQLGRPPRELPSLELPPGASLGDAGQFSLPGLPRQASSWEADPAEPAPHRPTAPARGFEPVKSPAGLPPERGAGGVPELRTGSFDLNLETLALQGLREIVASLVPGRSIDSRGDVARLISRLHNTFEVLCRSFLSLREGYSKFMLNLHLQRSAQYDPGRVALASARDPAAVAAQLLDFRENAPDASQALEAELKELSLHQVALLDGLMEGIRALLDELSPDAITNEVEQKGGARLGRGERALWQEYCERHARFTEDGEALARVFGAEFSSAYRNYRRRRGSR